MDKEIRWEYSMNFIVEENRICLKNEESKIVAEIDFEKIKEDTYNVYHTFVDDSLRGQGIANQLVTLAYEEITKKRNAKFEATCEYAKKWMKKI